MNDDRANEVESHGERYPVAAAAARARELTTSNAIASVQRALADQSSIAFLKAGTGYDLSVYDSQCAEPCSWKDEVDVDGLSDGELVEYRDGALQRLPLVADQLNHAVLAMIVEPTTEVGVGHLMEALDRVVDTVGTLRLVGDELDRRGRDTVEGK